MNNYRITVVNKLRDFRDGLANHEKYYSRKSNKCILSMHVVTAHLRKLVFCKKVAESRNLCATEIWSYMYTVYSKLICT